MNNILRKVETDEVIIYRHHIYNTDTLEKCHSLHARLVQEGKLEGAFNADKWMGFSGVKRFGMDFSIKRDAYESHIGKEFGISLETMKNMLRCYALYCNGVFVYQTISKEKLGVIKEFLEGFPEKNFKMTAYGIVTVEEFLAFIGTPDKQIRNVLDHIIRISEVRAEQRSMAPIINYLAIENEINGLFRTDLDEASFRKWFPIYFWVNITFILPLRATEMLVTPKKCIRRTHDGKVFLTVRRTLLKKGKRTVYYEVDKDYKEFLYQIPDAEVASNIEKYIHITSGQDRRFLFEFSDLMINEMLSLQAFNHLLAEFMETRIIGNPYYDFAKYATGIQEFEKVTAGDSRPIAMANLYFQNAGEDICRQLADHVHINTSSGYYTNISETIWASSLIRFQKRMEYENRCSEEAYKCGAIAAMGEHSQCLSEKRLKDVGNLDDCIEADHLADCMGCQYYRPAHSELVNFMEMQKKRADDGAKRVIEFMNNAAAVKNRSLSVEELFLSVQTEAHRYQMGCEISAKEKYGEWQELRNSQKTSF